MSCQQTAKPENEKNHEVKQTTFSLMLQKANEI